MAPKAERRALGKVAARKRQQERLRRERLRQAGRVAAPIAVVAVIALAVWLFSGGKDNNNTASTASTAGATASAEPSATFTMPDNLDPALYTKPTVAAGDGTALSALKVTTLVQGAGAAVASGQSITVNYVGVTLSDGKEFDASWDSGSPFSFQLGSGQVIPGWDQGLVGVKVGSRVQLDIPVNLAYNGASGYPAGDLRFVVDVLAAS
jgi:peptidylprolyl isomerase